MSHRPHAPYQALAVAVLLVSSLPAAMGVAVAAPAPLVGAWYGFAVAGSLWAGGGALMAALTFSAADEQRPGWLFLAGSYLVLVVTRLVMGPGAAGLLAPQPRSPLLVLVASAVTSGLAVAGFLLLTRACRRSGLDTSSRASQVIMELLALAIGLTLIAPDLVEQWSEIRGGDLMAWGDVVTELLDVLLLVVAAPALRAALALGGGLVAWPWIFLTASVLAWQAFDATAVFGAHLGLSPRASKTIEETFRALASSSAFSAGVAQRWVMTGLRRGR